MAAAAVMAATGWITSLLANPWLLLLSRIALAAVLYYAVMRLAGAEILRECMGFLLRRKSKNAPAEESSTIADKA